jgi:hypothetical protein
MQLAIGAVGVSLAFGLTRTLLGKDENGDSKTFSECAEWVLEHALFSVRAPRRDARAHAPHGCTPSKQCTARPRRMHACIRGAEKASQSRALARALRAGLNVAPARPGPARGAGRRRAERVPTRTFRHRRLHTLTRAREHMLTHPRPADLSPAARACAPAPRPPQSRFLVLIAVIGSVTMGAGLFAKGFLTVRKALMARPTRDDTALLLRTRHASRPPDPRRSALGLPPCRSLPRRTHAPTRARRRCSRARAEISA